MSGSQITSAKDVLARVKAPRDLSLDCAVLKKGIDNYHIDVELGETFVLNASQVAEDMVKRAVAGKKPTGQPQDMEALRDAYEDLIRDSLHRTKTDLKPEQVSILHFAVVKFVLEEIRRHLDRMVAQVEETLGQQQYSGSRSLLVTQEKFAWIRHNYSTFLYHSARAMLRHLQREETNQLRALRAQFLGEEFAELANILFNPMLAASSPVDPQLLIESYALWPSAGKGVSEASAGLEAFFAKKLGGLKIKPLKSNDKLESGQSEVYDTMGGLFAAQPYLGPSVDQKDDLSEAFCWLDHPGNMRLLFDGTVHERSLAAIEGIRAQWAFKADAKKLVKLGQEARSKFASESDLKQVVAGYVIRDDWQPPYDEIVDVATACAYVAGQDSKKILAKIDQSKEGAIGLIKKLDEWSEGAARTYKEASDEVSLRVLTDLSRFRLHLKYYRFAHRVFNRLNVITDAQQVQLSLAGGHLYRLLGTEQGDEVQQKDPEIIHHAILKADVRGSTTVTQELIRQNLNPASYFSTRFFGPINELLGIYGAVKVFIEGDAVILGIHEYDNAPEEWYSVARACGIAKEMLDIVSSKNAHSRQTELPSLEIGIGICYANERPLFLFDEDKPIMISSAIGDADRMSSCSWKLRKSFESGSFNVEVLEIDVDARERGEKGQHHLRYNVNGILLDDGAFRKLKSEITMRKMKVKVGEATETMYVGRFPDVRGKERDLIIREGIVGLWKNETAHAGQEGGGVFYEVLPNSKLASQVMEVARAQSTKPG